MASIIMTTCRLPISFVVGSFLLTAAVGQDTRRLVIPLDIPGPNDAEDSTGGIIVADVTGDGTPDFLVTCAGHLAVYDNSGRKLWIKKTEIVVGGQSESQGLPGHHGPGVAGGDVCLFQPLTGQFVERISEQADRLYVADVAGDWREEIIVLNRNELHVYENRAVNPRPNEPRLWESRNYRRLKHCHNYYSP